MTYLKIIHILLANGFVESEITKYDDVFVSYTRQFADGESIVFVPSLDAFIVINDANQYDYYFLDETLQNIEITQILLNHGVDINVC